MIVCLVLIPSKLHTIFKHSQFYIKFDKTYLLGIISSVFFFFLLLVFNRLFFCSNMYKGSVFFSLLLFSSSTFCRSVSVSLARSNRINSSSVYFNCSARASHFLRGTCSLVFSKLIFIYTPLRLN